MKIKKNKSGLTLMEILVAITIIAVLAAGLYIVSNSFERQFKNKQAESTIEILCTSLERYHDFYGSFPNIRDGNNYDPCCSGIERLYYRLTLAPEAKNILGRIDSSQIVNKDTDETPPNIYPEIVDPWQHYYDYNDFYSFPVITSAGPDGDFGNTDPNKAKDNITSK